MAKLPIPIPRFDPFPARSRPDISTSRYLFMGWVAVLYLVLGIAWVIPDSTVGCLVSLSRRALTARHCEAFSRCRNRR